MLKKRDLTFGKNDVTRSRSLPWRKIAALGIIWVGGTFLIAQVLYPSDKLLPLQSVDGMFLGGKNKADATAKLNEAYAAKPVDVYLGGTQKPVASPKLADTGMRVDNTERVKKMVYPWFLRVIPTSIFWASGGLTGTPVPIVTDKTDAFITEKLMKECQVAPVNATLKADGDKLVVVPGKNGGECDPVTVKKELTAIKPQLAAKTEAHVNVKELPFDISDAEAKQAAEQYMSQVANGVPLKINDQTTTIPAKDFYAWLDFEPADNTVKASVNAEKAKDYLLKNVTPRVAVAAGTATITTRDFAEISRTGGGDGRTLDLDATVKSLDSFLHGVPEYAQAITQSVPANITYVRTYSSSDDGINALLTNFAKDHKGTYGISYAELSGDRRRANYQGDKKFVTASTYKLFVAYSVLKRVESGQMSWDENSACFNKMITYSDNACAEMFLNKVGLKTVTSEINAMGLKDSNFTESGGPFTTANDLVTYLGTLEGGTMFSDTSKQRLVSAMLANVYRSGVPAGASGSVADKVGFMNGLLHDAAIVYSPKGTYVLAVMTDGSSWGTIADLTRELEKIR